MTRIDIAAASLRATLPVFTRGNLYHRTGVTRAAFDAALARRRARGRIEGLLSGRARTTPRMSAAEQRAYFPAAILLVATARRSRDIVDLFAASGALIQARVAVVDAGGHPRDVVRWLVTAARAGHTAPVGYLHDASTVLYPFFFEPLATLAAKDEKLRFRDLGFRPPSGFRDRYTKKRVHELEAATPAALVSYAVRSVLEMLEPDLMLAPRAAAKRASSQR